MSGIVNLSLAFILWFIAGTLSLWLILKHPPVKVAISHVFKTDERSTVFVSMLLGTFALGLFCFLFYQYLSKADRSAIATIKKNDTTVNTSTNQSGGVNIGSAGTVNINLKDRETEIDRRMSILNKLRKEYTLSHDGISPGLAAETEWPPLEWINTRLKQSGELWTVSTGKNPMELSFSEIQQSAEPYNIGVRSAIIYDGGENLSLFMVGYQSMFGNTISPVFYLTHIFISNEQNVSNTIEGYSVSVSDNESGPWQDLVPISLLTTSLYALGITNLDSKTLAFPKGAYRLGTSMKEADLSHSALMEAYPKIETLLRTSIQPSQTVGGWAAFDLKDHSIRGVRNYFRISIRDSMGRSFSKIVNIPKAMPGDTELDTQVGTIVKVGPVVDFSLAKIKYYSDPYSKQIKN